MTTMARLKRPKTLALDPELLDRIAAWRARQDVAPSETAVFEVALREFLEKRERKK